MHDYPHLTVSALCQRDGHYLMVEEWSDGQRVLNQPSGHVEVDETLIQAVIRETAEETGHAFTPEALVGIYQYTSPHNQITYVRIAFCGQCTALVPAPSLDEGIIAAHWLTADQIQHSPLPLRSPMVWQAISDDQSGQRMPLSLIKSLTSPATP